MIKVRRLKELLAQVPDDADVYAYEGEDRGIVVIPKGSKDDPYHHEWFIRADEDDKQEEHLDGFEEKKA